MKYAQAATPSLPPHVCPTSWICLPNASELPHTCSSSLGWRQQGIPMQRYMGGLWERSKQSQSFHVSSHKLAVTCCNISAKMASCAERACAQHMSQVPTFVVSHGAMNLSHRLRIWIVGQSQVRPSQSFKDIQSLYLHCHITEWRCQDFGRQQVSKCSTGIAVNYLRVWKQTKT